MNKPPGVIIAGEGEQGDGAEPAGMDPKKLADLRKIIAADD